MQDIKSTGESWAAAATMDLGGGDLVEGAGVGDRGGGVGKLETEQRRGRVWRAWYLDLRISPRMGLFDVFWASFIF